MSELSGLRARELLDAVVAAVGDEDIAATISRDRPGAVELTVSVTKAAEHGDEGAAVRELLDALTVSFRGENVAASVHGDALDKVEVLRPDLTM